MMGDVGPNREVSNASCLGLPTRLLDLHAWVVRELGRPLPEQLPLHRLDAMSRSFLGEFSSRNRRLATRDLPPEQRVAVWLMGMKGELRRMGIGVMENNGASVFPMRDGEGQPQGRLCIIMLNEHCRSFRFPFVPTQFKDEDDFGDWLLDCADRMEDRRL